MAETYKKLAQGQLATSVGRLYLCPGSTTTIVRHIRLVNTDSDIHSVTMHHIDSGVTPGPTTNILNAVNLAAGGWAEFDGTIILEAADELQGLIGASNSGAATDITYTIYGLELT
jgi:hypothetical protein